MPKILVNYKVDRKSNKTTLKYKGPVYADVPICLVELDTVYDDPVIVPMRGNLPIVMEREEFTSWYQKQMEELEKKKKELDEKGQKLFRFKINQDSSLLEVDDNEQCDLEQVLPKDAPINELRFMNGEIVWVDENKEDETKDKERNEE